MAQLFQHCPAIGLVVIVGRLDVGGQQPAARVDGELALAALKLFIAVKAFVRHAAFTTLNRLCAHDGQARAGLTWLKGAAYWRFCSTSTLLSHVQYPSACQRRK